MKINLAGVYPPVTTPFNRSGRLDVQAFRENLRAYNRFRLRGVLILGSSGEAASLEFEERVKIIESGRMELSADKLLLVGTGAQSLNETLKMTQIAAANGADVALVLPPFYYKPAMTAAILEEYYLTLARTARIPVMIYSIPQFSGLQMSVAMIAALSTRRNVIGLKESSGNVSYLAEIMESVAPRFQCLTGSALTFLTSLTLGAKGGILALADVGPQECIEIFEDFKAGRLSIAAAKQQKVMKLARAITSQFGIAGLKAGVTLAGFEGGYPRAPLKALPHNGRAVVRSLFEEMKSNW